MDETINYDFADAWLLVCLFELEKDKLDFLTIIEVGDVLNHAIFMPEEMKTSFVKLQLGGCILVAENNANITFSEESEELKEVAKETSNYKVIKTIQEMLNSSFTTVQRDLNEINNCDFITDDFLVGHIKKYQKKTSKK